MACSVHLHSWKGKDDPPRPQVLVVLLVILWHKKWKNWTSHVEFWPSCLKIRLRPAMLWDVTSTHLIANVQQTLSNTPKRANASSKQRRKPKTRQSQGWLKTELLNIIFDNQRFAFPSVKIHHGIPRNTNFLFVNGKGTNISYTSC